MVATVVCFRRSGQKLPQQPSNTKFIFALSVWLRFLVQPPGSALAYIDWVQQEFGVAAAFLPTGVRDDLNGSRSRTIWSARWGRASPAGLAAKSARRRTRPTRR